MDKSSSDCICGITVKGVPLVKCQPEICEAKSITLGPESIVKPKDLFRDTANLLNNIRGKEPLCHKPGCPMREDGVGDCPKCGVRI